MRLFLFLSLALNACFPGSYFEHYNRIRKPVTPPSYYEELWKEVEKCSGLTGKYESVRFYLVVTADRSFPVDTLRYHGYWESRDNSITLAAPIADDKWVVRHEMLHALIKKGGHDKEYFDPTDGKCRYKVNP